MRVSVHETGHHDPVLAIESFNRRVLGLDRGGIADCDDESLINGDSAVLDDRARRVHADDMIASYDQVDAILIRRNGRVDGRFAGTAGSEQKGEKKA